MWPSIIGNLFLSSFSMLKFYYFHAFIHTQVVIKYVPFVGDSKRAMDEYTSEICMGGHNTIVMHNTCEVGHDHSH